MGWTWIHARYWEKGTINRKKEMHHELFDKWDNFECLAESMVGTVYYAAVKNRTTNDVFAVVCRTSTNKKDYFDFGYKDMDETCGPCENTCPKKILKLLTPIESQWAQEWRNRCWEYHNKKAAPNAFKNLTEGTVVKWTVPHDGFSLSRKGEELLLAKRKLSPWKKKSPFVWFCTTKHFYIRPSLVRDEDYVVVT